LRKRSSLSCRDRSDAQTLLDQRHGHELKRRRLLNSTKICSCECRLAGFEPGERRPNQSIAQANPGNPAMMAMAPDTPRASRSEERRLQKSKDLLGGRFRVSANRDGHPHPLTGPGRRHKTARKAQHHGFSELSLVVEAARATALPKDPFEYRKAGVNTIWASAFAHEPFPPGAPKVGPHRLSNRGATKCLRRPE
jgi:hypothetical protein